MEASLRLAICLPWWALMVQKEQPPKHPRWVFGVRQTHIGQVEAGVDFLGGHRRLGRIHHHIAVAVPLYQRRAFYLVALQLNDVVVFSLRPLALLALLEGMKFYEVILNS